MMMVPSLHFVPERLKGWKFVLTHYICVIEIKKAAMYRIDRSETYINLNFLY